MKLTIKFLALISIIYSSMFITSCKKDVKKNIVIEVDSDSLALAKKFEQAKEILYSLPSPNEVTAILLQTGNTKFYADLLNPSTNYSKYSTEVSQALNLGIYSADLSYASLFDQNQIVVNYMATSKKLAENLRIMDAFDQATIERLERNVTNRDSMMRIISETFMNSDAFLQENNRQDIGALILIGGWLEGLDLSIQLTNGKVNLNPELTSSILEQQLSLELIVKFLEEFNTSKMSFVKKNMNELFDLYNSINQTINDKSLYSCSQADFTKLCNKVKEIRTNIIEMN